MNFVLKKENMLDDLKVNNYDQHVKAYYLENLGIKVVSTDHNGMSVIDTVTPLKSYVDHQIMNI
tara:strand:+ start:625 stop:816 length:192 start_codon:yes stop_codon:yes gene_type:complete